MPDADTNYQTGLAELAAGDAIASVVINTQTVEQFNLARLTANAVCQSLGIQQFAVVFSHRQGKHPRLACSVEVGEVSEES